MKAVVFSSTAQRLSAKTVSLRAGAHDEGVYICGSKDMSEAKQLLKPEVYKLTIQQFEAFSAILQPVVSLNMCALRTNGNDACAMHA